MKNIIAFFSLLIFSNCSPSLKIEVENGSALQRTEETVEIPWSNITSLMPSATANNVVVNNTKGVQIPSQVTADALIFQVTIGAGTKEQFTISTDVREQYTPKAFCRLVPERLDDWAWENNRIAFRMYGPALQATGEISNGIDIWVKRTPEMIINKWYAPGVNYHIDQGEGVDCYKVGRTLGAGAFTPISNDTLCMGLNFTKGELIDSGPIRTTFRLTYAPFMVGDKQVSQVRTISLDANSSFNRITELLSGDFDTLKCVAGITLRDGGETRSYPNGIAYSEPENGNDGVTHIAIIMPQTTTVDTIQNHLVTLTKINNNQPFTYFNGAGWSKEAYATNTQWQQEVQDMITRQKEPLKVKILK